MKSPLSLLLLLLLPVCLFAETVEEAASVEETSESAKADLHVSQNGDDRNPGTAERPLRTIQRAAQLALAGQSVIVHEGTWREQVRPRHSGAEGSPIVYKPAEGAKVVLSGTELLKDWEKAEDGSWSTAFVDRYESAYNYTPQVFADGLMLQEARSPNGPLDPSRPAKFQVTEVLEAETIHPDSFDNDGYGDYRITVRCEALEAPKDSWADGRITILLQQRWGWGMPNTGKIVGNEGDAVTFEIGRYKHQPDNGGSQSVRPGTYFHLFDARVGFDAEGEWWLDREANRLHLRLPGNVDPNTQVVEVRQRDFAFDLSDRSYIEIHGFELFAATITTDVDSGTGIAERYPETQVRFDVAPAHHITIDGIRARYLSHFTDLSGYVLSQWTNNTGIVLSGSDHVLKNSLLSFSAGNGVTVIGERHKVLNNLIHDTGYSAAETGAVAAGNFKTRSVDHEIGYNTMYTIGGNGMWVNALTCTDPVKRTSRIHHNVISDVGIQRRDIGYLYVAGGIPKGVEFDHNVMWGIASQLGFGIYIDYSHDWYIHHNVVTDTPWAMCLHAGERNRVEHNTLIGLTQAVVAHEREKNDGTILAYNVLKGTVPALHGAHKEGNRDLGGEHGVPLPYEAMVPGAVGSTLEPPVRAPTHLLATAGVPQGQIELAWRDQADNETAYILERGLMADFDRIDFEVIAELPADSTSYSDTLPGAGRYYYRVRCLDSTVSNLAFIESGDAEQEERSSDISDIVVPE